MRGVDVFWKPNGQMQLTATVNPDFGQVESDDLVVNFDATETFISDKRPFFTENQGIFEFTTPSDYSQLLYTRRVGGPADDGEGSGDITAALKLNGSLGATKYGVFAADEADVGRPHVRRAARGARLQRRRISAAWRPTSTARFSTATPRVLGVDHNWRPTARWNVRTRVIGSDIEQAGDSDARHGATVWADYEMDHGWRQQLIAMHFGNELQINDAGYLSRNSTNYMHWQVNRRFTDLPADRATRRRTGAGASAPTTTITAQLLDHQFRVSRESRLRNGSYEYGADQHQQRRRRRPAHARQRRGQAAAQLQHATSTTSGRARATGPTRSRRKRSAAGSRATTRSATASMSSRRYFISDAFNVYVGV